MRLATVPPIPISTATDALPVEVYSAVRAQSCLNSSQLVPKPGTTVPLIPLLP
jgi:hypothetical protein